MKTIPTAEKLLIEEIKKFSTPLTPEALKLLVINVANEHASNHVKAALEGASEKAELNSYEFKKSWMKEPFNCTIDDLGNVKAINKNSILNAYSLDNIK